MANNEYHFITHWRVEGTVEEVTDIIGDINSLTRWWPSVYLDVRELKPGDEDGVGRVVDLYTKGWLPYTLRWRFRVTEIEPLKRVVIEAEGDFVGRGIWTFAQEGSQVHLVYDWKIRAEKPLLNRLSLLLKPIFSANHHWAMQKGEESLVLELARRRAASNAERMRIPPPPPPTTTSPLPLFLGLSSVILLIVLLISNSRGGPADASPKR
jgi:hypothetical protein